jgi:hypothetical protein
LQKKSENVYLLISLRRHLLKICLVKKKRKTTLTSKVFFAAKKRNCQLSFLSVASCFKRRKRRFKFQISELRKTKENREEAAAFVSFPSEMF